MRSLLLAVARRKAGRIDHHIDHLHPARAAGGRDVRAHGCWGSQLDFGRCGHPGDLHATLLGSHVALDQS